MPLLRQVYLFLLFIADIIFDMKNYSFVRIEVKEDIYYKMESLIFQNNAKFYIYIAFSFAHPFLFQELILFLHLVIAFVWLLSASNFLLRFSSFEKGIS